MKMNDERRKVIKELLDVTDREFTDEELIRQLTMTGITQRAAQDEKSTLGQRAADAVARALGRLAAAQSEAAMGVITSNANFEREFGRRADKRRRLYNGRLECEFLMYDRASFRARRKHK